MHVLKSVAASLIFCLSLNGVELSIVEKKIDVNGKAASVYAITQTDGKVGLTIDRDKGFDVHLNNAINVPSSVHWHGLILPNAQDGVAFITQYPLYPHESYQYGFPLVQAGTFWMHSHYGLQGQQLLSAPLIITEGGDADMADQDVVVFLADFSFTAPSVILDDLRCKNFAAGKMATHGGMKMNQPDVVEVDYDAFLTNYHTLQAPEMVTVEAGAKIRLRIINGASATNFFVNLGALTGEAIAVDGNRIVPFISRQFELPDANRIDIIINIPKEGGAFPILAQAEGTDRQTGLVLLTKDAIPPPISERAAEKAGPLTNAQEKKLRALHPLPSKPVDKQLVVELGGNMSSYVWTINGQAWPASTPLRVEKGQRVEIIFKNNTSMSHPMHLHGHVFQVKAIDDVPFEGALRDTILVTTQSQLTVQFDADNPGVWPLHCHILYHAEAGMFTVLKYADFQQPLKSCP